MSGYNPKVEGVDGAAVWLSLIAGLSVAAIGIGVTVELGGPWWLGVLTGWICGAFAAAGMWAWTRSKHRSNGRPAPEQPPADGDWFAELGAKVEPKGRHRQGGHR